MGNLNNEIMKGDTGLPPHLSLQSSEYINEVDPLQTGLKLPNSYEINNVQ